MKKSRFTEEQIIGFLKQAEAGMLRISAIVDGNLMLPWRRWGSAQELV